MNHPTEPQATRAPRSKLPLIVVILLVLVGAGVAAYMAFQPRGAAETPAPPLVEAPVAVERVEDAGAPAAPRQRVEDGDDLLHRLGAGWSSEPTFAELLAKLSLRHLVAATQRVADGDSPRPALPFLSIAGPFAVVEHEARKPKKRTQPRPPPRVTIDPASYARYDELTRIAESVNAGAVGDAYGQLRPYLQSAFEEIGRPGARFDDVLVSALDRMSSVRVPEGEVELVPQGAVYRFKDERLERASAAEKQLMRFGPANARRVQAQLRTFAAHAGLPVAAGTAGK